MANPKIQLRHDTKANWETINPVLLQGEVAIETDTNRTKIGNGTNTYTELDYTDKDLITDVPIVFKDQNYAISTNYVIPIQAGAYLHYQVPDGFSDIQPNQFINGFRYSISFSPNNRLDYLSRRFYLFTPTTDSIPEFHLEYNAGQVKLNFFSTSLTKIARVNPNEISYNRVDFVLDCISKKIGIEFYYNQTLTLDGTIALTDERIATYQGYVRQGYKTSGITYEGSKTGNINVSKYEVYPADATEFYTEKTLTLDYDNTTLGLTDGKLTVTNGDAGGTLQTQINGLQTQITNLENNPPTPSNMVTTNTAQTITTNKNFQYGLGLGTAAHTLNRQIRVITNPTDTNTPSFTLPLVDVDRDGDVITFGSTNPNQSNRQIVFSTDATYATTKITFEANQPLVRNQMNPENEGTFTVYDTSMDSDIASLSALKNNRTIQELTVLPTASDYTLTDTGYFIVEGQKSGTAEWYFSVFMVLSSKSMIRLGGMPTTTIEGFGGVCIYGNKGTTFRITYGNTGGNITHVRFCPI